MKKINGYTISSKETGMGWIQGAINEMQFQAKVYDVGSRYGIDEGRVSKLSIRDARKREIIAYDRGWDIEPDNEAQRALLTALLLYLEALPVSEG